MLSVNSEVLSVNIKLELYRRATQWNDVTLIHTTYLNSVVDQEQPFMETAFPDGRGLFQQDIASRYIAKMVQEWFERHDNKFGVFTYPPNSPDLNPTDHLWDVLDKQGWSVEAPSARYHRTPSEVKLSPCLDGSGLFWRQKGGLLNIRQVVIMLWLIGVCFNRGAPASRT